MELPNLNIENVGTWQSPEGMERSRPRFVLRYELECYLGETGETWIDGVHCDLHHGTITFCRPGQLRFSRFPFHSRFLYFDVTDPSGEFGEFLASLPSCLPPNRELAQTLETMEARFHEGDYRSRLELQTLLFQSLIALSRSGGVRMTKKPRPKQDEVFRVIRHMKSHLYESQSVTDFATLTGYSVPHFNAFFRELLGTTPYEYYLRLKMLEARRLLLSERYNSTETARLLGFSSSSHFCAAFREACGQTPREFVAAFRRENGLSDEMT